MTDDRAERLKEARKFDPSNRFIGAQIGSDDSSVYALIQTCKTYDVLI